MKPSFALVIFILLIAVAIGIIIAEIAPGRGDGLKGLATGRDAIAMTRDFVTTLYGAAETAVARGRNLKDTMAKFTSLTNADFIVRMGAHEAPIYGNRVLDLLERAKTNLCRKYDFPLQQPTIVEIFPDQKDFGVRTFGIPDNPGYLGVCFGSVITAS